MPVGIVVDSGPLAALFDRSDEHHTTAVAWLQGVSGHLISNLAVVTEVAYLLKFSAPAQIDFVRWVAQGAVVLAELPADDFERVAEVMHKYSDLPADFTDASLVVLCERLEIRDVASTDHHFDVYRYRTRTRFRNLFPRA